MASSTATILFTDLVGSTEAAERAGHQGYERYRQQHFAAMREAIAANGGTEVKTVGDAFMAAFDGAGDAVACAIAMQQAQARINRRSIATGLRIGISAGDVTKEGGDYFGMPVVEASRLCAVADGGQVLVADVVRLLCRNGMHSFQPAGTFELKGINTPVAASEVVYELQDGEPLLTRTPFVGRAEQLAKLREKLGAAASGHGGLVLVVGEPGIGKTRILEEFSAAATAAGSMVTWGACYEGDWAPPYVPFAQVISSLARKSEREALRADLGYGGPPLARIAPALREVLPDIGEPAPLAPNEEQFRILDAAAQLLIASAKRAPLVLVLDDLHWADAATVAMLRHVARFCRAERMLVVGAYRDVELDRQHPLSDALPALRREVEYERILLKGLTRVEVGELLELISEQEAAPAFVEAVSRETDGNPFFVREVLLHLVEEGKLVRQEGRWTSRLPVSEMGIPEGVRQVIGRRLSRLSTAANQFLAAASAFSGPFRFDAAAVGAGLEEKAALDAVDEALDAQLIRAASGADMYEFTHALIRHTLYGEMNPSRQVRLHRRLAEALEQVLGAKAMESAAEIAYQYHHSAAIAGAEQGVEYALAAADKAEAGYAWDQTAAMLRVAVSLIGEGHPRSPRIRARLGLVLPLVSAPGESASAVGEAADALASVEGDAAAAEYVAQAYRGLMAARSVAEAAKVAAAGMRYAGSERNIAWGLLLSGSLVHRDLTAAEFPGVVREHPEHRDLRALARQNPAFAAVHIGAMPFDDRNDVLGSPFYANRLSPGGDLLGTVRQLMGIAEASEREGQIDRAASYLGYAARAHFALGDVESGEVSIRRAEKLCESLPGLSNGTMQLGAARFHRTLVTGEGWQDSMDQLAAFVASIPDHLRFYHATANAFLALAAAACGEFDLSARAVDDVRPFIELTPGWLFDYPGNICDAATALWWSGSTRGIETIEDNLRRKALAPDFRNPMRDSRLALAQLCILQGRSDEARHWFGEARNALDEQGARPLRGICDFDEAWALVRAAGLPLTDPAFPAEVKAEAETLLDAALAKFEAIGMPGWARWASALRAGRPVIERMPAPTSGQAGS